MTPASLRAGLDALALAWSDLVLRQVAYSTLLFLLVLAVTRLAGGRLPRLRHGLWALVLLRLLLPPGLQSPWSARTWLDRRAPPPAAGLEQHGGDRRTAPATNRAAAAAPWRSLLFASWLGGVLVVAAVMAGRRTAYRRRMAGARPVRDPALQAAVERWRRTLGVRRPVQVVTAEVPLSPFTIGLLRPCIYLPGALLRQADATLPEAVVAHELAHVQRRDDLWLRLQNLIQILYFFHPVAWLAASELNQTREELCDAQVLEHGLLGREVYAASLIAVLRLELPPVAQAAGLGSHKRRYTMRIRRILDGAAEGRARRLFSLAAALLAGLLLLPMASGTDAASPAGSPALDLPLRLSNPLPGSWLSSPYGWRRNPFSGEREHHAGVDVATDSGRWVHAPAAGVVTLATTADPGAPHLGTVVRIDHGHGVETFYAHLGDLRVRAGEPVSRRTRLARVGSTGLSTGPHLHFEVWQDGATIDPELAVTGWSPARDATP